MPRFRNPRYAPESLERKLSPSSFGLPQVAVLVGSAVCDGDVPTNPGPTDPATGGPLDPLPPPGTDPLTP